MASVLAWQVYSLDAAARWVDHTDRVIGSAAQVQKVLLDLETGLRGYLLTGDEQFLEPYHHGREVVDQRLEDFAELVADNPAQVDRIVELGTTFGEWLAYAEQALQRAGGAERAQLEQRG
ncbi:MAG: CHASE3 domain-containing protein, partial [Myxococcales bacterium]